jgi:general secretion pathway protein G
MYWVRKHPAFTFIEVMIVVVIIGLLAATVTLSTRHFVDKAKENRARSDLSTFKSALAAFYADAGRYPTNDEGLTVLAPKYIDKVHNDPWGRGYQYNEPGRSGPYEVLCLGSTGKEGDGNISSDDLDITASSLNTKAPP